MTDEIVVDPIGATGTPLTREMLEATIARMRVNRPPEPCPHGLHPNAILAGGWQMCALCNTPIDVDALKAAGTPLGSTIVCLTEPLPLLYP